MQSVNDLDDMELPQFPRFCDFLSSDELEKLIFSIGNAGYNKAGDNERFKYFLSLCQYSCMIPALEERDNYFYNLYQQAVLDTAMMNTIEDGGFLKWSKITTPLLPVTVPNDGNSLFHAVCTAMWGLKDNHHTLKQLMERTVSDMAESLFGRWKRHNSNLKIEEIHSVWSNIIAKLQGRSTFTFTLNEIGHFTSIAIYVLANMICRPIIVIDCISFASAHHSSAGLDMEGIFLPLDRSPADCCQSPIILCHKDHHFCPMMSESMLKNEVIVPLNKGDLSLLPIRYLIDDKGVVNVLSQYLNVKEKYVKSLTRTALTLLCSFATVRPLPEHLNSMNIHFQKCQEIFHDFLATKKPLENENRNVFAPPSHNQSAAHPFHHLDENNQTYVVSMASSGKNEDKPLSSSPSPSPLPFLNSNNMLAPILTRCKGPVMNQLSSALNNATFETRSEISGFQTKNKCLTPGCLNEKDPCIGELCESCFKKDTAVECGFELQSIHDGDKCRYVKLPTQSCGNEEVCQETIALPVPIRNEENVDIRPPPELHSMSVLSVMNELCQQCSQFFCSKNTYPYCHECSNKKRVSGNPKDPKEKYSTHNAATTAAVPKVANHLPLNINPPQNIIKQKQGNLHGKGDRNEKAEYLYCFCHEEGCLSLRKKNSELCSQCIQKRKTEGNGCKESQQIRCDPQRVSYGEERSPFVFGQAECLSQNSDEDVIEISEAPSLRYEVRQCASPVCQTLVSAAEALCEKCQNILIFHSQYNIHNSNSDPHKGSKNKGENKQIISAHNAAWPPVSGIMANTSPSKGNQGHQVHSEKVKAVPRYNIEARLREAPIEPKNKSGSEMKLQHNFERQPLTDSSATLYQDQTSAVTKQVIHSPSVSRTVDSEFQKMYQQLTNEHRKDISSCHTPLCPNYGNISNFGYCNACFYNLTDRERHVVIFGRTECD